MILVSHIFDTLDLSSTVVSDSLSISGPNLPTDSSINNCATTNMLPQNMTSPNSSTYYHFVLSSNSDVDVSR